jgi:hypothetical protein
MSSSGIPRRSNTEAAPTARPSPIDLQPDKYKAGTRPRRRRQEPPAEDVLRDSPDAQARTPALLVCNFRQTIAVLVRISHHARGVR